jgi:hypothetical protein
MVVGVLINDHGHPVCCEIWPGGTADVKTLLPVADRLKKRFAVDLFFLVANRGCRKYLKLDSDDIAIDEAKIAVTFFEIVGHPHLPECVMGNATIFKYHCKAFAQQALNCMKLATSEGKYA